MRGPFQLALFATGAVTLSWALAQQDESAEDVSTRLTDALMVSRPRARRFCTSFSSTESHAWYPSFIMAAFGQPAHPPKLRPAGNPAIDDALLSSACASYMASIDSDPDVAPKTVPDHELYDPQIWTVLDDEEPAPKPYEPEPDQEPLEPLPAASLIPVLHIDHDLTNVSNLRPQDSAALFYAEQSYTTNPYVKHIYTDMNVSFSYPTVVIDSTHFLTNMACHLSSNQPDQTGGTLTYQVETKEAFDIIDETWPRERDLVLVLQGEDCERTENGTRAYFLGNLHSLSWSDEEQKGLLDFVGDEILLEEGITDASLEWGIRQHGSDETLGASISSEDINKRLCGADSHFVRARGIPSVDPCIASFDVALDQAHGYAYEPVATRYDNTRLLLVNAEAREDLIVDYINTQLARAAQISSLGYAFRYIWQGTRSLGDAVWQGIAEVGKAFDAAGDKTLNTFRNLPAKTSAAAKRIGNMVYDGLRTAGPALIDNFKTLQNYLRQSAKRIPRLITEGLSQLDRKIQSWQLSPNVNLNINLGPKKLTQSPWGEAWLLLKVTSNSPKKPKSSRPPLDVPAPGRPSTEKHPGKGGSMGTEDPDRTTDKSLRAGSLGGGYDLKVSDKKAPTTKQSVYKVYCVGCGLHSNNRISGQARFSMLHGASTLKVGMDGDLDYGMGVGVEAESKKSTPPRQKTIIPAIGLPVTTVKGVLTFGPIMQMRMSYDSNTFERGELATGMGINTEPYRAHFDFVHPSSSTVKGLQMPHVKRFFTANGAMSHTASFSLPFSIGVGVVIPPIKLDKQAKLVNRPAMNSQVVVSGTFAKGKKTPPGITIPPNSRCDGMTYGMTFSDEADLVMMNKYSRRLFKFKRPIANGCFKPTKPPRDRPSPPEGEISPHVPEVEGAAIEDDGQVLAMGPAKVYPDTGATWGPVSFNTPLAYLEQPKLIVDSTHKLALVSALDGNLYLLPFEDAMKLTERKASTVFSDLTHVGPRWVNPAVKSRYLGNHGRTLITDGFDRAFHYFPDTLARYGVSRLRMLSLDEVPLGANQSIMEYGKLGKHGRLGFYFVNAESPFTATFPVGCMVKDASGTTLPKVFAVNDLVKGLKSLQESKSIASAVTGGTVKDCQLVHLVELRCERTSKGSIRCPRR